jgi:3-dehydroquinate synthase
LSSERDETEPIERVPVDLGPRSYEIRVVTSASAALAPFLREALARSWAGRSCSRALIVTDEHVATRAAAVAGALREAGITSETAVLPPGEGTKSLEATGRLYQRLVEMRADRHTLIVALGGGVIGDLAGFVAATFTRGLPLFMIPTSLLAQVDSSVGGKVGINLPTAKNLVGAFHQPIGVWIDTAHLATLPEREYRCGLAEVVKYGVILDAHFLQGLEASTREITARDPAELRRIVARSCELKAEVVTRDEREETGLRAVLNFGHTIGHAIEAVAGYGRVLHGEAVALGMVAECRLAERIGWVGAEATSRLSALLEALGLPTAMPELDPDELLAAMTLDKKNQGGRIRFVLPTRMGRVELTDTPSEADLRAVLS